MASENNSYTFTLVDMASKNYRRRDLGGGANNNLPALVIISAAKLIGDMGQRKGMHSGCELRRGPTVPLALLPYTKEVRTYRAANYPPNRPLRGELVYK